MILAYIRFHNADAEKIFLNDTVQHVVRLEYASEQRMCAGHEEIKSDREERDHRKEDVRHFDAHRHSHDDR